MVFHFSKYKYVRSVEMLINLDSDIRLGLFSMCYGFLRLISVSWNLSELPCRYIVKIPLSAKCYLNQPDVITFFFRTSQEATGCCWVSKYIFGVDSWILWFLGGSEKMGLFSWYWLSHWSLRPLETHTEKKIVNVCSMHNQLEAIPEV